MVLLEKKIIESQDGLKAFFYLFLKNESETLLFDCPAVMSGSNFRSPTFEFPQKKIKYKIPLLENVDRIFVTSSESLGILFLKKDIDIYITLPTYEQLLSNYYSLLDLHLTYDDYIMNASSEQIVCLDEVNIDRLKRNIKFITYNEMIRLNEYTIECKSSGMFVGWCTFVYRTLSKSLHIMNKITIKKKYAIEYEHSQSDFEINLNDIKQSPNPIEELNEKLLTVKDKSLIIACDIPTSGIDLMFHLLYVFKNSSSKISLFIKYNTFSEYLNNLCNHTEWMSQTIKSNPILDNFTIIDDMKAIKTPSIVLIDSYHVYELNSNKYDILTIGEVMKDSFVSNSKSKDIHDHMFLDTYYFSEDSFNLNNDETYSIELKEETKNVTLQNTLKDFDGEFLYLIGCVSNTDSFTPNIITKYIDNSNASSLNTLFENEVYFYNEDTYYFPKYRFKIIEKANKIYRIDKC